MQGFTPEVLKKDHTSLPRNPLIASVFYARGLIEKWGRGTQKIVQLCVAAGHPEPEFWSSPMHLRFAFGRVHLLLLIRVRMILRSAKDFFCRNYQLL